MFFFTAMQDLFDMFHVLLRITIENDYIVDHFMEIIKASKCLILLLYCSLIDEIP